MNFEDLPHKPLVEAILELRWGAAEPQAPGSADPQYKLLPGRFFERVKERYPFFEELDSAKVPPELVPHIVQYRFRPGDNEWPLIQLGPGVLTTNQTEAYSWAAFQEQCRFAVDAYFASHEAPATLSSPRAMLRYIDAVESGDESPAAFVERYLKVPTSLPATLRDDARLARPTPETLLFQWRFDLASGGAMNVKITSGTLRGNRSINWELLVEGQPEMPAKFEDWLTASHELLHDWFFALVEGELLERFAHA